MSLGSRSGVNCTRRTEQSIERASAPGTGSGPACRAAEWRSSTYRVLVVVRGDTAGYRAAGCPRSSDVEYAWSRSLSLDLVHFMIKSVEPPDSDVSDLLITTDATRL